MRQVGRWIDGILVAAGYLLAGYGVWTCFTMMWDWVTS